MELDEPSQFNGALALRFEKIVYCNVAKVNFNNTKVRVHLMRGILLPSLDIIGAKVGSVATIK